MRGLLVDLGPYVAAVLAAFGGWAASRSARKASDRKVDAEAYDRAEKITDAAFTRQDATIARLESELADVKRRATACDRRCSRMEVALQAAGLPLPGWDEPEPFHA